MNHLKEKTSLQIIEEINSTWNIVLLQRLLKALGSFAYLSIVAKKGDYLKYEHNALQMIQAFTKKNDFFHCGRFCHENVLSIGFQLLYQNKSRFLEKVAKRHGQKVII